jgi:nephrocystin-3
MSLFKSLFSKNSSNQEPEIPQPYNRNQRSVRVFVSSTFRDMIEDRNELMTHCWPELRKFCAERYVELVEVDLRWGIAEEQSTRKETLKLCLDEIRACRPFFVGLLGERYGWIPGDDAFTADLKEEQPWLKDLHGKSVTELEILHGVLNNPEMAGRAFFYFRDPGYTAGKGPDFLSESEESVKKQAALKELIRKTCKEKGIPLNENYSNPTELASLVLEHLRSAIDLQFPIKDVPDPLDREALDHEAFAESRRRTYIGRSGYFEALDKHCNGDGKPLLVLGDSGSGKSALLANWVARWHEAHPADYIFQHYIGGTSDSSSHWKLMTRLMGEIKRWTEDAEELPKTNDDIQRDFTVWLSKAGIKAKRDGVKFIVVLDALNQLDDKDHAHILGWLPTEPFRDNLRLVVSALPGTILESLEKRALPVLRIESLSPAERGNMISDYLKRFGKKLDNQRVDRLSNAKAAANPLFLKILLDELRVTGTHAKLDERIEDYLSSKDIPDLLGKVLARYRRDYEQDRKGLVGDALGLIWAARRGLTEKELLQLLRPDNLPQLPLAIWSPLRAVLEESLIDRRGILNFAHDFMRTAVEKAFLPDLDKKDEFRLILADYFEAQVPDGRNCDELPWLLMETESFERLRECLLNIDSFLLIYSRDEDELSRYWVEMSNEKNISGLYLDSFMAWANNIILTDSQVIIAADQLGNLLMRFSYYKEATFLIEKALSITVSNYGQDHPMVARCMLNLVRLYRETNRLKEAQSLVEIALKIYEKEYGPLHVKVAEGLNCLAQLLQDTNRMEEAETIMEQALKIYEKIYGPNDLALVVSINNLAQLLKDTNRLKEAEPLMVKSLSIIENNLGKDHPFVGINLNNLAELLRETNRMKEAEPIFKRALKITEENYGMDHPLVAAVLNNLAQLLQATNRWVEAESLMIRAIEICEKSLGDYHPNLAVLLNNLAQLLQATNRLNEAELVMRRHLMILIFFSQSTGHNHPHLENAIRNYAALLESMGMSVDQIYAQLKTIGISY